MKKATFALTFNRKKRLNKQGKGAVDVYCYIEGGVKFLNTGVSVLPGQWDKKRGQVKDHPNATKLNFMLSRMVNKLEDYELSIHNEKGDFAWHDLERFSFNGDPGAKDDFITWLKKEVENDNSVSSGTKGYRFNMVNKLTQAVGETLPANRVTYETIKLFNNYMADQGLKQSTQAKLHNQLKKFISVAVHEGIVKKNPYGAFKVKRPVYDMKKCLWFPDLEKVWDLSYPEDSTIELARLKFLLSCYTGLRISDNTNLAWDQVRGNKLFVKMQKTARPVVVPLNVLSDRAKEVLDKAKNLYNDPIKVFPYMPDQKVNSKLKLIGIDAELPFPLTFHAARHTFCTMIAHKTGSVFKVMEYAGIYKVDTAMVYINLNKLYAD